jgi:hypothetical protein
LDYDVSNIAIQKKEWTGFTGPPIESLFMCSDRVLVIPVVIKERVGVIVGWAEYNEAQHIRTILVGLHLV